MRGKNIATFYGHNLFAIIPDARGNCTTTLTILDCDGLICHKGANLLNPDIDVPIRLPWTVICKLAVKARIGNLELGDLMRQAIEDYVALHQRQRELTQYVEDHPELTLEQVADLATANGLSATITMERRR